MLLDSLWQYEKVGIFTHMDPDADALGSCFALQMALGKKRASVVLEAQPRDSLFDEFGAVSLQATEAEYDAVVVLDAHEKGRLGKWEKFVGDFKKDIFVVDHHQIGNEKLLTKCEIIDPTAVSTGVLIFNMCQRLADGWSDAQRVKFARAVYYTILGDTDGFQNRNLNAECFAVCSTLLDWGLEPAKAYEDFFCKMKLREFAYLAEVYKSAQEYEKGKIVFAFSGLDLQEKLGFAYDELPSVIGRLKQLKNYEIIVVFKEKERNLYKLSFRSKSADVRAICANYGGGGHLLAAGCQIRGEREEIEKEVLDICKKKL